MRKTSVHWILLGVLALAPAALLAQQAAEPKTKAARGQTEKPQAKTEEAKTPKALVIVPWKSSKLGNGPSVSTLLDDSRRPVDKEVFMRMLSYYEISSETARPGSATTDGNAAAPANAAQRRKP